MIDRFIGEYLPPIESGGKDVHSGTVLPCQIIQPDVPQFTFADFVAVETQIHLRKRTVKVFDPRQSRQSRLFIILPVNGVGVLVQERLAFGGVDRADVDEPHNVICRPVVGNVGDPGDSGSFDERTVLIRFAGFVQTGDQFIHIRNEIFAGGNDDGLPFPFRIIDPFHLGSTAVSFDRRLDEWTQICSFEMFEFIKFADDANLSVIL